MRLKHVRAIPGYPRHRALSYVLAGCAAVGLLFEQPAIAIPITPGTTQETFTSAQAPANWSTSLSGLRDLPSAFMDEGQLDGGVALVVVTDVSVALPLTGDLPPTADRAARQNVNGQFVQTYATAAGATLLLATLNNATGRYISGLNIQYDLSRFLDPGESVAEEIPGHRVYYSTTGTTLSWTPIGSFATPGRQNLQVTGLGTTWGRNPLYLLWADDNSAATPTTGEAAYGIDNVAFTPTLGEFLPPDFGAVRPPASQTFSFASTWPTSQLGGAVIQQDDGQGGTTNDVLRVNSGTLRLVSEQIDLRGYNSPKLVSIDVKTFEDSAASDFEASDVIQAVVEYSEDGNTFCPWISCRCCAEDSPLMIQAINSRAWIRASWGDTRTFRYSCQPVRRP